MNVLSGVYPYGSYTGDIIYDEKECKFQNIRESENEGIVIIHQELALIPYLSIKENIFLGNERSSHGIMNWGKCRYEAVRLMETVGLQEDPDTPINQIGVGKTATCGDSKRLYRRM